MALNEEQVGQIRLLLASSGWNDVMRPVIAKRAHDAIKALVLHPAERTGEYKGIDDNTIRVKVRECEWLLTAWANEVMAYDNNQRLDELDRQQNGANPQSLAANP
jgi:hypothetical protein